MIINQSILDKITEDAKVNPWLRQSFDLRTNNMVQSQRVLNAIEPGSRFPIHRHQKTSETIACLRGRLVVEFYDESERICIERVELEPGGVNVAVNIPLGLWHSVYALESGTVLLEAKDGRYEPLGPEDILE